MNQLVEIRYILYNQSYFLIGRQQINSNNVRKKKGSILSKKDIPRIELGLLDSKSNVLTITPYVLRYYLNSLYTFMKDYILNIETIS